MKINQHIITNLDSVKTEKKTQTSTKRFDHLMENQRTKLKESHLQALMKNVEEQGTRLARSRSFKELVRFKGLVKDFVKESVDYGMNLKQTQTWDEEGFQQTMRTVQTIDEKLVQLTDEILEKEQDGVRILDQIGEIKGLLINLYA